MTTPATQTAIWTPGWYELDQTLLVGQRQKFWFFATPPSELVGDRDAELFFFNRTDTSENCVARFARIEQVSHSVLGPILRVDTEGLDYIFFPVEGEEVVVNAEEEPGQVYDGGHEISDWSLQVTLSDVSEPVADFA